MFNSPEVVTNFVFFQFSGPRPWYTLLHTSNDFESSFECLKVLILSPLGNSSVLANEVFVKRWVHNFQSMFMQFMTVYRYGL